MLVVSLSPEFKCRNEVLSIATMLSGWVPDPQLYEGYLCTWLRPSNRRGEADAARALFSVPEDHLVSLLNVYNGFKENMSAVSFIYFIRP